MFTNLPSRSFRGAANDGGDDGASCLPLCKLQKASEKGGLIREQKIIITANKKFSYHCFEVCGK